MRRTRSANAFLKRLREIVIQQDEASDGKREWPTCTALEARMLELRAFLEHGIMPLAGSLNDQHPLYVASMLALKAAEGEVLRKRSKGGGG